MKKITLNAMIYFLGCMAFLSCSGGDSNKIKDADSIEKSFGEYKLLKPGTCDIDLKIWKIGPEKILNKQVTIARNSGGIIRIQGLVMDRIAGDSGIALYADISGYRYKAITGIDSSVIPKYSKAGYLFEISPSKLELGIHKITFYLIKNNGQAYCSITDELTLDVR